MNVTTVLRPNPAFLKRASTKARKKWHDALINAYKEGIRQAHGKMFSANQHGKFMCCLMVGHEAFGGDLSQRSNIYPNENSPFTLAFNETDYFKEEYNPPIAILEDGGPIPASMCNDLYNLSFTDIAKLVFPGKYGGRPRVVSTKYTPY